MRKGTLQCTVLVKGVKNSTEDVEQPFKCGTTYRVHTHTRERRRVLTRETGSDVHPAEQLPMTQHGLMLVAVGRPHPLVDLDQSGVWGGREVWSGDGAEFLDTPSYRGGGGASFFAHAPPENSTHCM